MATSTCPKCDGHDFEMKTAQPKGTNYKVMFVQCSSCGCVIGVLESYSAAVLVKELANKLKVPL